MDSAAHLFVRTQSAGPTLLSSQALLASRARSAWWARGASRALFAGVAILLLGSSAGAGEIVRIYDFPAPTWTASPDGRDFEVPSIAGARTIGPRGEPQLPVHTARILLPPGEELTAVRVQPLAAVHTARHLPAPAEAPYPLSWKGPIDLVAPKAELYGSNALYPAEPVRWVTTQVYRGHRIAYINLHPLRARLADGEVEFTSSLQLTVETAPSAAALAASARTYRPASLTASPSTSAWLARNVDNPERAAEYEAACLAGAFPAPPRPERSIVDPADHFLYVIVTSEPMVPVFEPLAADRTAKGLPATIVTSSEIYAHYTGVDPQEQIRNFILDAYQGWGIEYVLFAGDINVIPDRDCYCYVIDEGSPMETNNLCCELYYEGLDGTWNDDHDDRWGEPGEEDLIPDIYSGRVCADNSSEAQNFIAKLLRYEREPVVEEVETAAFFGEYLWTDTWGAMYMEEIRLGADSWGYTTAGVPLTWETDTHYEMTGSWSASDYINQMNSGTHQMHHLGHSSSSYNAKVYSSSIPSFTADGVTHTHCVGYSQGCDAGSFDTADAILEEFILSPTGYVAWIGNTRYGFGIHYTTNGSSQYYHRQYVDALFGEGINDIGAANGDSRADNVGYIDYEANRWVHYELTVFGDPAMPVWTAAPQAPVVSHAGVFVLGNSEYTVAITAGGSPVAGARVCAWDEIGSTYDYAVTGPSGQVTLDVNPSQPGTLRLVLSDANLMVTEVEVPIIPAGPYVIVYGHEIDDTAGGNGDGHAGIGEEIELRVALQNVWSEPITGVTATLSSDSPYVTCTEALVVYGDLDPGVVETPPAGEGFRFFVHGDCPDQEPVEFLITIHDDAAGQWSGPAVYTVDAPALGIVELTIDDSAAGNGNGLLDPGESALLTVRLANSGHSPAEAVAVDLQTNHPYLSILQGSGAVPVIEIGSEALLTPPFEIALAAGAPSPGLIGCNLCVTGDWSLEVDLPMDIGVGGFRDDMEAGEGGWTHEVVTPTFIDDWHRSGQRNHTLGGSHSWKFGDSGTGNYANLADGALVTPVIAVAENTLLTFWHWIAAETSSAHPGRAYDGGLIEMSVNGGAWEPVTPDGGYSHLVRAGGTPGPFPEDTPIFSGEHDWEPVSCTLVTDPGTVQFRFRFGSDGAVNAEGWYIDDVEVRSWGETSDVETVIPLALRPSLSANRPNPFPAATRMWLHLPEAGDARVTVIDPQGRLVRTLLSGHLSAGQHSLQWDGIADGGQPAGSGVYFYRLDTAGSSQVRKMTLLR